MKSRPKEPAAQSRSLARIADVVVRWLAPLATALAFLAVLLSERTRVEHDLQLVMPSEVLPGRSVAMRAFLFADLDEPRGPRLARARVTVRLRSASGGVLAQTTLSPSAANDIEGTLAIPPSAAGRFIVHAEAPLGGGSVAKVQAPLTVTSKARPLEARGRLAHPLQQYTLFPMRFVDDAASPGSAHVPLAIEPRVLGGACAPDHLCEMLVYRSDPRVTVSVDRTASVELVEDQPDSEQDALRDTASIVPLDVRVHGPEAEAQLVAMEGGRAVARRTVRLPVALGVPVLRVHDVLQRAPANASFEVEALEPERALIVDAFRNGFWERTGAVRLRVEGGKSTTLHLPFAALDEGVWRIQVRTDPFSSTSAATRIVHVRAPAQTETDALRALLSAAGSEERRTFASAPSDARDTPSRVAAFLLSPKELDLIPQPPAISGALQATWGVDDRKRRVRFFAIAMVVLCGVVVVSVLLRRGLRADAQARELMERTDEHTHSARHAWSATIQLVSLVAVVALVFLAVVMMMLARGGW